MGGGVGTATLLSWRRTSRPFDILVTLYVCEATVIGVLIPCRYTPGMDTKPINIGTENMEGWRPERCGRVALVLQGGGALGGYQGGVYQALHEEGLEPDWVSGVSIGGGNPGLT